MNRRQLFTNKKRLKGKNMSITDSLIKIRMSALKETRNKFGFSSVWTADGKILYDQEGDTKTKVYFDWYSGKQELCYRKNRVFFLLMASIYFYLNTVSYFVFLILFRSILPLINKIILIKTQFVYFISLNNTILLCLQFANLDCNKILTSISQLYHLTISCVKINGQ